MLYGVHLVDPHFDVHVKHWISVLLEESSNYPFLWRVISFKLKNNNR